MKVEKKTKNRIQSFYILKLPSETYHKSIAAFFLPLSLPFAMAPCHVNVSWEYVISRGIKLTTHAHLRNVQHETDHELDLNESGGDVAGYLPPLLIEVKRHSEKALFTDCKSQCPCFFHSLLVCASHCYFFIVASVLGRHSSSLSHIAASAPSSLVNL